MQFLVVTPLRDIPANGLNGAFWRHQQQLSINKEKSLQHNDRMQDCPEQHANCIIFQKERRNCPLYVKDKAFRSHPRNFISAWLLNICPIHLQRWQRAVACADPGSDSHKLLSWICVWEVGCARDERELTRKAGHTNLRVWSRNHISSHTIVFQTNVQRIVNYQVENRTG